MSGILNSDKVVEREQGLGLNDVVFPGPKELQIDIDSEADYAIFRDHMIVLTEWCMVRVVKDQPSKTSGHRHVTLEIGEEVTPLQRLLLQACLGSDRKRELLGFLNLQRGDSRPTLFIIPKIVKPKETLNE